jgi:hypothetical protein
MAACGLFTALAVGTKLYYLATVPPLLLLALTCARDEPLRDRLLNRFAPLAVGFVLGVLPIVFVMARDTEAFFFNNLFFHSKTTALYENGGIPSPHPGMDPCSRVTEVLLTLGQPTNLCLLIGIAFASLAVAAREPREMRDLELAAVLPFSLLAMSSAAVTSMNPLWPQYAAMPVPFAVLLICGLDRLQQGANRRSYRRLLYVTGAVSLLYGGGHLARSLPRLFSYDQWMPIQLHRQSLAVRRLVPRDTDGGPLATLMPIFAVESGLPVDIRFSTGVFLYWIGDTLTARERQHYSAVSRKTIEKDLEVSPPCAILVGGYPWTDEEPLVRFAERHNYIRFDSRDDRDLQQLVLYARRQGFVKPDEGRLLTRRQSTPGAE